MTHYYFSVVEGNSRSKNNHHTNGTWGEPGELPISQLLLEPVTIHKPPTVIFISII